MDHNLFISLTGALIIILLAIIGWSLNKFFEQQNDAHKSHQVQFKELIGKLDTLNATMSNNSTDVEVMKSQVMNHADDLKENKDHHDYFYRTLRAHENDITSIKTKIFKQ
jgi:ABC-type multidrug transport system fused ATPase/permease subunit